MARPAWVKGGAFALCAAALSLLAVPVRGGAQPADEFFHGGAQSYIQGQKEKAKDQVITGLKQYPQDAKLNAMAVLLQKPEEKPPQQQPQNQQEKDQQDQQQKEQKEPQKDQKDQSQEEQKQSESKPQESKQDQSQPQSQEKPDQGKPDKNEDQKNGQPADKSEQNAGEEAEAMPGQMTPEQAQQLLDAQKSQEKMWPPKPETKAPPQNRRLRDW
jgi:hypothetical protein